MTADVGYRGRPAADFAAENEKLYAAGEALITAIERQLSMTGKGIAPSDRVIEAIAVFRSLRP